MLYKGLMVTALSGKLDGLIASHNRGGAYFKQQVIPVDPNTTSQQVLRQAMTDANTAWNAMSDADRAGWTAYARRHTLVNRLGDRHTISGFAYFSRWAIPRYQGVATFLGGGVVGSSPPPNDDAGGLEQFGVAWHTGNSVVRFSWLDNPFQNEDHDYLMFYIATPRAPTINWFRGPYLITGAVSGDPDTPIPAYYDLTLPSDYRPTTGQKTYWRARLSRQDYDLSAPFDGVLIGP